MAVRNEVSIQIEGDRVILDAPYNPSMPAKAKAIGGKWDAGSKTWRFDKRDEARVRDLARATYGTDGSAPTETVTVRVELDVNARRYTDALWLFGRLIASRQGRDMTVRLGDGVILIAGGFPRSGGSRANPDLSAEAGTILEVRDVPANLAAGISGVTVVDRVIDRDALVAERERIMAMQTDINPDIYGPQCEWCYRGVKKLYPVTRVNIRTVDASAVYTVDEQTSHVCTRCKRNNDYMWRMKRLADVTEAEDAYLKEELAATGRALAQINRESEVEAAGITM